MIDAGLVEALNHSIDRLNLGESIADCLRTYPQYAAELAPLLEVGGVVRRAQASADEAVRAMERQRGRFERALNQPVPRQRRDALPALARLVAILMLVFTLLGGGAGLLAESSLPGDLLYGLKLWTEELRVSLANHDPEVQAAFAARRIEEARQLVQLHRSAEMTLTGVVERVDEQGLWLRGLLIRGEFSQIALGSRVEIDVRSTEQGELIALQLRLLDVPTDVPLLTPTVQSPLQSSQNPRLTDRAAVTPTVEPTATASPAAGLTPQGGSTAACDQRPDGWVRYLIQPGDTLSALSVASGSTVDEIVTANCLEDARSIIAGQVIYLPRAVVPTSTRPLATESPAPTVLPPTEIGRPEPTRPPDR